MPQPRTGYRHIIPAGCLDKETPIQQKQTLRLNSPHIVFFLSHKQCLQVEIEQETSETSGRRANFRLMSAIGQRAGDFLVNPFCTAHSFQHFITRKHKILRYQNRKLSRAQHIHIVPLDSQQDRLTHQRLIIHYLLASKMGSGSVETCCRKLGNELSILDMERGMKVCCHLVGSSPTSCITWCEASTPSPLHLYDVHCAPRNVTICRKMQRHIPSQTRTFDHMLLYDASMSMTLHS
eukprot:495095-Hanusia_phi.AAC.2